MIRGSLIGSRFDNATFDNYRVTPENQKAYDACKDVRDGKSLGIVLTGKAGVGKTHLLVALAREFGRPREVKQEEEMRVPSMKELIAMAEDAPVDNSPVFLDSSEMAREAKVEWWPVADLVRELRNAVKTGESDVSERCRTCDLLIIDDFGQERNTEFTTEELDAIWDWRYRDQKAIAISTGLTIDEIRAKYGDRGISRWSQQCRIVSVGGADQRARRE
jgi:DNA replication protein DnaC